MISRNTLFWVILATGFSSHHNHFSNHHLSNFKNSIHLSSIFTIYYALMKYKITVTDFFIILTCSNLPITGSEKILYTVYFITIEPLILEEKVIKLVRSKLVKTFCIINILKNYQQAPIPMICSLLFSLSPVTKTTKPSNNSRFTDPENKKFKGVLPWNMYVHDHEKVSAALNHHRMLQFLPSLKPHWYGYTRHKKYSRKHENNSEDFEIDPHNETFHRPFLGSCLIMIYLWKFDLTKLYIKRPAFTTMLIMALTDKVNTKKVKYPFDYDKLCWISFVLVCFEVFGGVGAVNDEEVNGIIAFLPVILSNVIIYTISNQKIPGEIWFKKSDKMKRKFLLAMSPVFCGICVDFFAVSLVYSVFVEQFYGSGYLLALFGYCSTLFLGIQPI